MCTPPSGVIVPPKSQPVQRIFEGVVSPFNGSRPSSDGDFKVGSFFAEVANNDVFSVTRERKRGTGHATNFDISIHPIKPEPQCNTNSDSSVHSTSTPGHERRGLVAADFKGSAGALQEHQRQLPHNLISGTQASREQCVDMSRSNCQF